MRWLRLSVPVAALLLTAAFNHAEIDVHAGDAWAREQDYERSVQSYTRAIDSGQLTGEMLAAAHFGRAEARTALAVVTRAGDAALVAALKDYNRAIELKANEPFFYRARGSVHIYLGAYDEAFADFAAMRPLEGDKPMWSLVRKGGLQRLLGDYQGAMESFQAVLKAWNNQPLMPVYYHMALTHMKTGEPARAVTALDEGMKAQPDYFAAFLLRGCARARLGQYREALADYRQGTELYGKIPTFQPPYPAEVHDTRIIAEERKLLEDLAAGRAAPDRKRIAMLCEQSWWRRYFDRKRARSKLLPK